MSGHGGILFGFGARRSRREGNLERWPNKSSNSNGDAIPCGGRQSGLGSVGTVPHHAIVVRTAITRRVTNGARATRGAAL
jgi:hypothetical protein